LEAADPPARRTVRFIAGGIAQAALPAVLRPFVADRPVDDVRPGRACPEDRDIDAVGLAEMVVPTSPVAARGLVGDGITQAPFPAALGPLLPDRPVDDVRPGRGSPEDRNVD